MNRLASFTLRFCRNAGKRRVLVLLAVLLLMGGLAYGHHQRAELHLGRQQDGSFIVSTEQRVEPGSIAFDGRPIDLALHPTKSLLAVLNETSVVLISPKDGVISDGTVQLRRGAGFRGVIWSPDGNHLFVSLADGWVQQLELQGQKLTMGPSIRITPVGTRRNPRPGGMAITRDGLHLFVAAADRNAVAEIDLTTKQWVREYPVENLPFEVKLSPDEKTLIVTDWGGREVKDEDESASTGGALIVVDPRGVAASGTVSLIRRDNAETKHIKVGLHPTAIALQGNQAYVTNAGSDSISEIDLKAQQVVRTIPLHWGAMRLFGSMPCAITIHDGTAYVCNGGDNAVCEVDLAEGKVRGFRPAGYYPIAIVLGKNAHHVFALNTKGNGSVRNTIKGLPGNAHDFQGTVSAVDLSVDLTAATAKVALDNGWNRDRSALHPKLAVYNGAIKHVLYIIKENRSYDEVLGDMSRGNGDPNLCLLGQNVTPNHHALATQFTLFDNAYVAGTNSADGHQWCTQALANDYMEHFYAGYRTYAFGGDCAMSISSSGCLWDTALKKKKTIRDYGEFCDARLSSFTPPVKSWMDVWKDRISGKHAIEPRSGTRLVGLRPYINRRVLQWPLLQSDQQRADVFIEEYLKFSKTDQVPDLAFLTLPCDHTEGRNPNYPQPQCMVADNDLALGRVVEAVSHSPQWKNTCIFVIEDDAQFGRDHVDGHRTVYYALSPYTRRQFVDHELCNTVSMVRSIELMLGLDAMNCFDALTPPLVNCFTDTPNLAPYTVVPNRLPLDEMNPQMRYLRGTARLWTERSLALDWSDLDHADPQKLNDLAYTLREHGIFDLPPGGPSAYTHLASTPEEPAKPKQHNRDDDD